jgi:membrane-bound lytic murein transglycosylase B
MRLLTLASALLGLGLTLPAYADPFSDFLHAFEPTAVAAGISPDLYEAATKGIEPDPSIEALVQTQPEFNTPIWTYLDQRVSDTRIKAGIAAFKKNRTLFNKMHKRYGVDPYLLAAIWGIETNYGSVLNNSKLIKPVIPSLATLVYLHRSRYELDKLDFIAALKLVQRGPLDARHLLGSWAGAIGHLQVNPSNVIAHGTDGDGDGKIDLQDSLADALATSSKYLLALGYKPGLEWGYEVTVPAKFDYSIADRTALKPIRTFTALGVKRVGGRKFASTSLPVFFYAPAGAKGPKFLMTNNFQVLKGYNQSDSYALAVSHLQDRLMGTKDFATPWPRDTKFPDTDQRKAIQAALIKLGYLDGEPDGRLGPATSAAYAKYQKSKGEVADGFVTLDAYEELAGGK